jgi:hypothetical protein
MNSSETGAQLDLAEPPCLRVENYSTLLDEILASPAGLPSHLSTSEDFQLPAVTSAFRTKRRLADLEAKLSESQEKMSQTLKSMSDTLALLTCSVLVKQSNPVPHLTTNFRSELKPALPPKYDGNRQHSQAFINTCQAFFRLRPDQFPEEQIKIQWAMTYMSQGQAQKWVNRIYQWEALPANVNVHYFVDWDHFRSIFRNEFYLLHADAVATNILEGQTYFQGDRNIDNYLDNFQDLISESGYTSPKTIVVKFRCGLDPKIGDAVVTMAANRPDDLDPDGWYEAAVRVDQNRAMNAAFRGSIETPNTNRSLPCEPTTSEAEPKVSEDEPNPSDVESKPDEGSDVTNIKDMSADDIRQLLQQLSQADSPPTPTLHLKKPKTPTIPTAPVTRTNQFQGLIVEETPEDISNSPLVVEATCERQPKKPQWEKRVLKQPKIGAAEVGLNSLYLWVEVESTDTQQKYGVCALVDSGATGLFIDREYVKSNQIPTRRLSQVVPVYNVDRSANQNGAISEVAELLLRYNGHSERALFCVTGLGKQNLILGHTWLKDHNPEVDWRTRKVEMSRCSPRCCNGCRTEVREERKLAKKETANVNACRSGPFPTTTEDTSEMSEDELVSHPL